MKYQIGDIVKVPTDKVGYISKDSRDVCELWFLESSIEKIK